jgi:uncharacterized protein
VLVGCAPGTTTTRFYVLSAAPAPAPALPVRDVTVGVGPVTLPAYLDRPQVVTRTGRDEVDIAEFDRWAEPLRDAVPRVLAENLAGQIPADRVVVFPWRATRGVLYQVAVEVTRFDGATGSEAVLRARWRVLDGQGRELAFGTSDLREATSASGYVGLVAAQSRLLGRLSAEIAAGLASAAR